VPYIHTHSALNLQDPLVKNGESEAWSANLIVYINIYEMLFTEEHFTVLSGFHVHPWLPNSVLSKWNLQDCLPDIVAWM
jgi:hypothetical protein